MWSYPPLFHPTNNIILPVLTLLRRRLNARNIRTCARLRDRETRSLSPQEQVREYPVFKLLVAESDDWWDTKCEASREGG